VTALFLTVSREALLPALTAAGKVVEKRSTIPVLQNVLLEASATADGLRLTVAVNNLDQELTAGVPCQAGLGLTEGQTAATTVSASHLLDAVRKLPENSEIALADDGKTLTVSAGRSRFRLPVLPASDFQRLSGGIFSHHFEMEAKALSHMLASVQFAVSTEETRYYLCGVYLHTSPDGEPKLNAVATDGHRLAKMATALPEGAAGMPSIIVPRKTIGMLKSLVGDTGTIGISLSDTKILFAIGEEGKAPVTLTSKLIDGTYPDYSRVVPAGNPNRFRAARSAMLAAIDRVVTISASRGSAVKHAFGSESVTLTAENPDAGSAEDLVEIEMVEGDPVEIGFNGRYCLDMLSASPSEQMIFELGTPGSPALIRPEGDSGALFVLMPMRV
jgi:DNA polymerase III subunit beta